MIKKGRLGGIGIFNRDKEQKAWQGNEYAE